MFNLVVCGLNEADAMVRLEYPTFTVSLLEPGIELTHRKDGHVIFRFDDVISSEFGCIVPTSLHLELILDETKHLTDRDNLLVHCFAGISRSTAIATAILIQHGLSFADALEKVYDVRDCAKPNALLIELIDKHFRFGGRYIEYYLKRTEQRAKAMPLRTGKFILPNDTDFIPDDIKNLLNLRGN